MHITPAASSDGPALDVLAEMRKAGFNVRKYQNATLDTFNPEHDEQALDAARHYVRIWRLNAKKRWQQRSWCYFYGAGSRIEPGQRDPIIGKLGNGKTFLTFAIARALLEEGLVRPGRLKFITVEKLFLQAEATFRAGSETSEARILQEYAALDLLVLDELGVRPPASNHCIRLLDEITKDRESNGLLWTGNLSLPVIEQQTPAMKRVTDRILGECGEAGRYICAFIGPSWRERRAMGAA